jgi:hypothetical protein
MDGDAALGIALEIALPENVVFLAASRNGPNAGGYPCAPVSRAEMCAHELSDAPAPARWSVSKPAPNTCTGSVTMSCLYQPRERVAIAAAERPHRTSMGWHAIMAQAHAACRDDRQLS